jgi:hypothetical protein
MSGGWHYARNGQSFGPFVRTQLQELAATGKLLSSDLFWKDGMKEWKPADSIKGLFKAPKASQRSAPSAAAVSHPPFSGRAFLIGGVCGLGLGLVLGVLASWSYTVDQDRGEDKERSADLVKDQKQGESGIQPGKRPEALRLTSGSKRPGQ